MINILIYDYYATGEGRNICVLVSRKPITESIDRFYKLFTYDPTEVYTESQIEKFLEDYSLIIPELVATMLRKGDVPFEYSAEFYINYG